MKLKNYLSVSMTEDDIRAISTLGLAHVGDGVYELMVRSWLCEAGRATAKGLHRAAVGFVSAGAQARAAERILPMLTQEERAVYRRGRNARVNSVPRGATLEAYHAATAVETLFGYLYLNGNTDRLNELFNIIIAE